MQEKFLSNLTTVWDEMSFGWPSDGNKPIGFGMNSGLGSIKTKYCKKKKRKM